MDKDIQTVKSCISSLRAATEAFLTNREQDELVKAVNSRARSLKMKQVWLEKKSKAYNMAIDEIIEEQEEEKRIKSKTAYHDAKVHTLFESDFGNYKNKALWWLTKTAGSAVHKEGSGISGNAHIKTTQRNAFSYLYGLFRKENVLEEFKDNSFGRNVTLELGGYDSKDPVAKRIAESYKKSLIPLQNKLLGMGIPIKRSAEHIAGQIHNKTKMLSATGSMSGDALLRTKLFLQTKSISKVNQIIHDIGFNRWKNFVFKYADIQRVLEKNRVAEGDEDKFWLNFYDAKSTGIHKKPLDVGSPFLKGSKELKNLLAERKLLWKDPIGFYEYNKEYGTGNAHDSMLSTLESLAHTTATMEFYGTNREGYTKRIEKKVIEASRVGADKSLLNRTSNYLDLEFNRNDTSKGLMGKIVMVNKFMMYSTLGHLGLTSISDINILASAMRPYGISWLKSSSEAIKGVIGGMNDSEAKELAEKLGIVADGTMGGVFDRFGSLDGPKRFLTGYMRVMGRLSGIDRLDRTNIYTAGALMTNSSANYLEKYSHDELPDLYKKTINRYGITQDLWETMRKNKKNLFSHEGKKYLTRNIFSTLSDDDMKSYMSKLDEFKNKKISKSIIDYHRDLLTRNYDIMINDQVMVAKTLPDKADMAFIGLANPKNSFVSALVKSMTVFLPFHVALIRRVLGNHLYRNGAESLEEALFQSSTRGDLQGLAKYAIGGIPFGYLSLTAMSVLRGDGVPDIEDPGTWEESMMRGGSLFLYGSYLDKFSSQNPSSFVSSIAGTPIKMAVDEAELVKDALEGKNITHKLAKLGKRLNPISFYGAKEGLNKYFFDSIIKQTR